jgi:hypothetical protein
MWHFPGLPDLSAAFLGAAMSDLSDNSDKAA